MVVDATDLVLYDQDRIAEHLSQRGQARRRSAASSAGRPRRAKPLSTRVSRLPPVESSRVSVNSTRVALLSSGSSPAAPCGHRQERTRGGSTVSTRAGMTPWTPWSKTSSPPGRRSISTGSPSGERAVKASVSRKPWVKSPGGPAADGTGGGLGEAGASPPRPPGPGRRPGHRRRPPRRRSWPTWASWSRPSQGDLAAAELDIARACSGAFGPPITLSDSRRTGHSQSGRARWRRARPAPRDNP